MNARTFVIGDIHGDAQALDIVLARLPPMTARDTLVFLGDYVDRGPDSLEVVQRVQQVVRDCPARTITLMGNHEAMWIECYRSPELGFLMPRVNGCAQLYRSFTNQPHLEANTWLRADEVPRFCDVASWFPRKIYDWMTTLRLWHEDGHAIYVHAGLEGEGSGWFPPHKCSRESILWMRETDFFLRYRGKRLVFGHTKASTLPAEGQQPDDSAWRRGPLIGLDTGCGKGGFLSALELPAMRLYESR